MISFKPFIIKFIHHCLSSSPASSMWFKWATVFTARRPYSVVFAVMRCPSVRLSVSFVYCKVFSLYWCSHCNSVVQSGGGASIRAGLLPWCFGQHSLFSSVCIHIAGCLSFIVCLCLLLFVLSNKFDLIWFDQNAVTAKHTIKLFSSPGGPIILVSHRRRLWNSDGVTPNRGAKYRLGTKNLQFSTSILETMRDMAIVTIER